MVISSENMDNGKNDSNERRFKVDVYALREILDSYGQTGLYRYVDSTVRRVWTARGAENPLDAIAHVVTALGKYRGRTAPRWAQSRIGEISERDPSVLRRIVKEIFPPYDPEPPRLTNGGIDPYSEQPKPISEPKKAKTPEQLSFPI